MLQKLRICWELSIHAPVVLLVEVAVEIEAVGLGRLLHKRCPALGYRRARVRRRRWRLRPSQGSSPGDGPWNENDPVDKPDPDSLTGKGASGAQVPQIGLRD